MSVKLGLLALLAEGPSYGNLLKTNFESRTGNTWPLNVGQVYQTLTRLVRDGLVQQWEADGDSGTVGYRLTDAGRAEVETWWLTPVDRQESPRDELLIKLALAVTTPGVDVPTVVQTQRTATVRHLRDLTRLKVQSLETAAAHDQEGHRSDRQADVAWRLVLENLIFAAEGEVRWLDHVEATLARAARDDGGSTTPALADQNPGNQALSATAASETASEGVR